MMFVTTTARLTHAGAKHMIDGECVGGIGVSGDDWQTDARIAAVESIGAAT